MPRHTDEVALVVLQPSKGHQRVRLAAGSTPVPTLWPETSPLARSARRSSVLFGVVDGWGQGPTYRSPSVVTDALHWVHLADLAWIWFSF